MCAPGMGNSRNNYNNKLQIIILKMYLIKVNLCISYHYF